MKEHTDNELDPSTEFIIKAEQVLDNIFNKRMKREIYVEDAIRYEEMVIRAVSNYFKSKPQTPTK